MLTLPGGGWYLGRRIHGILPFSPGKLMEGCGTMHVSHRWRGPPDILRFLPPLLFTGNLRNPIEGK
jgi:hypothetical protein